MVLILSSSLNIIHGEELSKKVNLTNKEILSGLPNGILEKNISYDKWIDNNTLRVLKGGKWYHYNLKKRSYTACEPPIRFALDEKIQNFYELELSKGANNATLSPDNNLIAYTDADNNLCVYNIESKSVKKLTTDGNNLIMNGYASWVYYEEILGRPSNYKAFWWAPDSKSLAFYRFDDSNVAMFPIYKHDGQYGEITQTRYPKAGDKNPEVKIGFVNVEEGNIIWGDFNHKEDQYFGIPFWNGDGTRFIIPWMNRDQNNLLLYSVNPLSGAKNEIYKENQKSWIDWMEDMQFTEDGFFMVRDFAMWEQIYFQSFDGKRFEQITSGKNWGINFIKVDIKEGAIYFTARRDATTRNDFYRVDLKSKEIIRLSKGDYNYTNVLLSPDNRYFVATYSNSTTPNRVSLFTTKKSRRATETILSNAKGEKFDNYKIAMPEMLSLTTPDGYTIPAYIIYPIDMDSTKRYPVLVSMYGGPNAGTVMDIFRGVDRTTQWWANNGVIQVSIDHRASGHCGKEGLNFMHRNLLTIELQDYIEWMKYFFTKPYINRDKVGIVGFSYGGSMTFLACSEGNDYFKYGIAGGGVYDYNLYDTHYAERYMDRPQDNKAGYDNTKLYNKVAKYKGDSTNYIKITHGAADDNVHLQNTLKLINALQDAGKQFDLMIYPGQYHGYRGKKQIHSLISDYTFWYRHLLDSKPDPLLIETLNAALKRLSNK